MRLSFNGSGVRNLFKYSKCYSGKEPEYEKGDIFRIVVLLHGDCVKNTTQAMQETIQATKNTTQDPPDTAQLADRILLRADSEKDQIKRLMLYGIIERTGYPQRGKWVK